nr:unnamed protein product [Haemonchus contortus]
MIKMQSAINAFTGTCEIASRTVSGLKRKEKQATKRATQSTSNGPSTHPREGPHSVPGRGSSTHPRGKRTVSQAQERSYEPAYQLQPTTQRTRRSQPQRGPPISETTRISH